MDLKIGDVKISFKDRELRGFLGCDFEYKTSCNHNAVTQLTAHNFVIQGKIGVIAEFNYVPDMPALALRAGPGEASLVNYAKGLMKDWIVVNPSTETDLQTLVDELGALHEAEAPPETFDAELEAKLKTFHPDVMVPYDDRMRGYLALVMIGKSLHNPKFNVTGIFWGPENRSVDRVEGGVAILRTWVSPFVTYRLASSITVKRG